MINFLIEILDYIKLRKKYLLIPILLILFILSLFMFAGTSAPVLKPFLYTIF